MIVARSPQELDVAIDTLKTVGGGRATVACVPTMGSLHEGHLSLIDEARTLADVVVASVYVNPLQFAPGEDFDAYPRDAGRDADLLASRGCDLLFLPDDATMYPPGFSTRVLADRSLAGPLCGSVRGIEHFDGVVTVVARLFGLIRPDFAVFGEKDWQQLKVVERMTSDLLPFIRVVGVPTARDVDGLALSSRNAYLDGDQRLAAVAVPDAGAAAAAASAAGIGPATEAARSVLEAAGLEVEYCEVRDAGTLALPSGDLDRHFRLFIAARLGSTRLIDNFPFAAAEALAGTEVQSKPGSGASTGSPAATATA